MARVLVLFPFRLMYVAYENGQIVPRQIPCTTRAQARAGGNAILAKHPEIPTMYIVEVDADENAVSYDYEFLKGGV